MSEAEARERIAAEPSMIGRDLAREVTIAEPRSFAGDGSGPRIVALDTGIKRSIVRNFVARGATLELFPCTTPPRSCSRATPTGSSSSRPRRPGGARLHRRHHPRADRAQAGVRHLPRPPAALARGRAGDLQAPVRPPRRQPPGQGPAHRPDRDHLAEPRLRGRAASPGARLESDFGEAELTHVNLYDGTIEGFRLLDVPPAASSTTPRPGPGRTTRSACSTSSSPRSTSSTMPGAGRPPQDPRPRLRPDRDRPGRRVRLLGRAGLQGAARGGLRGRARQLQPGDDHDRPGVRDRDLRRAAAARPGAPGDRARAARRAAADARRPDRAQPRQGAARGRHARGVRRRADRRELRRDLPRRGPRAVRRHDAGRRPAHRAQHDRHRLRRGARARSRRSGCR